MKRDLLGVGVIGLSVGIAYAWLGHYWLDPVDEGYFLDQAYRVFGGALPYRDFTTYYTPGNFYLLATAFHWFGVSVLSERYVFAVIHALIAVLMFVLARRVAPWPVALVPVVLVLALDHWPIEPEPHPSWPAILACLATMEAVARHLASGRFRWLAAAGAATAVAFVFKQNIGAFTALGVALYVLLRTRPVGPVLWWLRPVTAATLGAIITLFLRRNLDPPTFLTLVLPLLATLGLLAWRSLIPRPSDTPAWCGVRAMALESVVAGGTFVVVTLAWLAPLVRALGPGQIPFALFVGLVEPIGIETVFDRLSPGLIGLAMVGIWVPAVLAVALDSRRWPVLLLAAGLSLLLPLPPLWFGQRDALTLDPDVERVVTWLDVNFGTLNIYLPGLACWAGVAALALLRRRCLTSPGPWFVLFGALAALTMYPRSDPAHALVSLPPALIGGTWAVGQAYRGLRAHRAWQRALVTATLLIVPIAIVLPTAFWRLAAFRTPEQGATPHFVPLGLDRAPVLLPSRYVADLRGALGYLEAGTPPGEPVFAYPLQPLINFLIDRPNPTRYDHFVAGTLSPAELQEVIDSLEVARPRYVLWDHIQTVLWGTDPANRLLSDYLWNCYREVAAFRFFLILERDSTRC